MHFINEKIWIYILKLVSFCLIYLSFLTIGETLGSITTNDKCFFPCASSNSETYLIWCINLNNKRSGLISSANELELT